MNLLILSLMIMTLIGCTKTRPITALTVNNIVICKSSTTYWIEYWINDTVQHHDCIVTLYPETPKR